MSNETPNPYANWQAATEWQNELYKKGCHKALDIPEDMNFQANRTGMGWRELLAIGATLAGLMGMSKGLGLLDQAQAPVAPDPVVVQQPIGPPEVTITQQAVEPRSYTLEVSTGKLPGQADR